ncbi:MAG: DUF6314 family protein [Chlamydiota bacterium]
MLEGILGSKSAMKVLFFLFVNERCYGSQIHSLLGTALTPIQKTLERLEKDGMLISHYEGKLRVYTMNPIYPLRNELEILLKKAYSLLSCQEKKAYCFIHKPRLPFQEEIQKNGEVKRDLLAFWELLRTIKQLSFSVTTKQGEEQYTKVGKAEVVISSPSPSILIYSEKGYWFREEMPESTFNNSFRWTLDLKNSLISLEHLRYGPLHPVFLFQMTFKKPSVLEAIDSHLCASDVYLGYILRSKTGFDFYWRIIGPAKNDRLTYRYLL